MQRHDAGAGVRGMAEGPKHPACELHALRSSVLQLLYDHVK